MRILIDCRCLQESPPRGGVGVFAEQLTRAMLAATSFKPQAPSRIEWILSINGLVDPRKHLPQFDSPNVRWMVSRWPNKVFNAACSLQLAACSFDADVVFLPNLNFIPPLPRHAKLVVIVHDLSFEHFPDCFTMKQRLWHHAIQPRKLLARADAIIAVSETTKRDVVETYGIDPRRVRVIYPGVGSPTPSRSPSRWEGEKKGDISPPPSGRGGAGGWGNAPFILSISELSPRKNLDGLIAAFEQLVTRHLSLVTHLIIAGNHGSAEAALRRQISRSPARDRIHPIGPVSENEKRALLARASCFVYPSLWEGFGFPPLEAMAAGCPVVASTGGSLPEVLGDAALLVDPLDPAAIADAIARVLTDDMLRTDLIARGRTRAAHFHWDQAADRVLDVLASA